MHADCANCNYFKGGAYTVAGPAIFRKRPCEDAVALGWLAKGEAVQFTGQRTGGICGSSTTCFAEIVKNGKRGWVKDHACKDPTATIRQSGKAHEEAKSDCAN